MQELRFRSVLLTAAVAATAWMYGSYASAAPVAPGGSVTLPSGVAPTPVGELVDEDVRTVTFQYEPASEGFDFVGGDVSVDVTFRSQVYRDPATQFLTFVYAWEDMPPNFGREGGNLSVDSFLGFTTDVGGLLGGDDGTINRSADGSTIKAIGTGFGLGAVDLLLVATDATAFDAGGSLTSSVTDEFTLFDVNSPDDQTIGAGVATVSLAGTFQPIVDDDGNGGGTGGGGGGTPIPLPAGVWGGMMLLGGTGLAGSVRRRLARRRA